MIVVSDAGPIHYLTLIGHVDILSSLYGEVAIPASVAIELSHRNTPETVRALMSSPPPWLTVHTVSCLDPELEFLGKGEREAIVLAGQIGADALLCDDLAARQMAARRHLSVVGTLGVLRDAAIHRLLEIRAALDRLSTHTNFRASQDLYVQVLQAVLNELGQTPAP